MSVVSMSERECGRVAVLSDVRSGRLRVSDACALLSLRRTSLRQSVFSHRRGEVQALWSAAALGAYRDLGLAAVRQGNGLVQRRKNPTFTHHG